MENVGITYPQLTCVVTNTELTMIAAGCLFKEKSALSGVNTSWHDCIDHKLELVTKLAFKDSPESNGTMSACRAIVTYSKVERKDKGKTRRCINSKTRCLHLVVEHIQYVQGVAMYEECAYLDIP
jgi:hypothetical protein